jgi:hypothetical protein
MPQGMHSGDRKPTVDEVYGVIDRILGQTRALRRDFEAKCAGQTSVFSTRDASTLDMDGDLDEAQEGDVMEEEEA